MCRKLVCLASLLLVLGVAGNVAAELVAHWRFDDGAGNTATDSVGNAHPGTIGGTANWVAGQAGRALDFDGSTNYVDIGGDQPVISGTFSLTMWIYARNIPFATGNRMPLSNDSWVDRAIHVHIMPETSIFKIDTKNGTDIPSNTVLQADQWYHVAGTLDSIGESKIYINGVLDNSATGAGREYVIGPANIGAYQNSSRFFDGMIDDVRIYNHILSEAEIQQTMWRTPPGAASEPSPINKATDVSRDVVLSWTPGKYAPAVNGHIVYLSESFNDVNDGIGGIPHSADSYDPGRLEFETTYYWRVDEVNAPPTSYVVFKGDVWSFAVEPLAYPIGRGSVTATASSSGLDKGPENTVNGSGLDENGLHSTNEMDMWLSDVEANGAWIQYELDKVRELHQMRVWNHNTGLESAIGFGIKEATIEYSVNGSDWVALGTTHEFAQAPGTSGYAHNTTVDFGGVAAKYVRLTANSNWGGILKQYGLSEVRFSDIPVNARQPNPDSGATDVDPEVTLGWRAGRKAATHAVYLSTDEQAVIDGTSPVVSVTDASYSSVLDLGSTYYWRIDEVNEAETPATWQGDIWSFSTPEYLVVEDFESYNDIDPPDPKSQRIFEAWIDGFETPTNGALVGNDLPPYTEQTIIHGGGKSMPFFYSNTSGVTFSEAVRTFSVAQDWTRHTIRTLALYFYGTAGNTGQLYVKINGVKVPYNGDMSHIQEPSWHQWDIDLSSVAGVNLRNVNQIAIGVDGTGSGMVFFDDIRLCP